MEYWRDDLTIDPQYVSGNAVEVVEAAGAPVAFYGLREAGEDWWLDHLWVQPEYIGKGCGGTLLAAAVARARSSGASALLAKADPNAEAFYLAHSWKKVGEEHYTLPDGTPRRVPILRLELL